MTEATAPTTTAAATAAAANLNGKSDRFRKNAERRVTRAIEIIRKVGNLANRTIYDYNPDQIEKMFGAMHAELDIAEGRFVAGDTKKNPPAFLFD